MQDPLAANSRGARSRRRRIFDQLPDEIVENIFLEDVLDDEDLCELALVSRRINRLAQVSLYSQVEITLLERQYKYFKRTLLAHPKLGSYVREARLIGSWLNKKHSFRRAQKLMELLPALRVLEVMRMKCTNRRVCLLDNPMPHLRYISFSNDGMSSSIHEVTKAMSFPKIKRLVIDLGGEWNPEELEWTRQGTALSALAGKSSLKDLTVDLWVDLMIDNSDLLKVPKALEKLTCIILYSGDFSPNGYAVALRPVHSTLIFLQLKISDVCGRFIGPAADFSCFVCLKTLIVDDALCFEPWSSVKPDERSGFCNRLPFTLEVLKVGVVNIFRSLGYELS
jgi:hypothetical protein